MGKFVKGINQVVHILLVLLMVVLVVTVFCQIGSRFVLGQPLVWTEELSRYSMIWMTFLGAAYAISIRAHIGMELLVDRLQGVTKQVLIIIASIISLIFFVLMVTEGFSLSMRVMDQPSAVLQIPMGIVYSIIPISGVILVINLIDTTIKQLKQEVSAK